MQKALEMPDGEKIDPDDIRTPESDSPINRCEALFAAAIALNDIKTALSAQKELNKLRGAYAVAQKSGSQSPELRALKETLALIDSYIRPLNIATSSLPTAEHCRVASELIRSKGLNNANG